jgi:hypothetical protein
MENVDSGMLVLGVVILTALVSVVGALIRIWLFAAQRDGRRKVITDLVFATIVGVPAGVFYLWGADIWPLLIASLAFGATGPWIRRLYCWLWNK